MEPAFIRRRRLFAASLALPFICPAQAARIVAFAGEDGAFQDRFQTTVIEGFQRANPGIAVSYQPIANSAQILHALRWQRGQPMIDVAMLDAASAAVATNENLLEVIPRDSLPVLRQLSPKAFIDGVAGPAALFDNLALLYAPQSVKTPPTSWLTLWNAAFRDRIAIPAAPDMIGLAFCLVADKLFGGGDYRASIAAGMNAIGQLASSVRSWDPKPDPYSYVAEGNAALSVGWNARGQTEAQRSAGKLAVAIPDEGSVFRIKTINLVKGGRDPAASRLFLAHVLSAEAQKAFADVMFCTPANMTARLAPASLARTAATAERLAKMQEVDWVEIGRLRGKITDEWRRQVSRLR